MKKNNRLATYNTINADGSKTLGSTFLPSGEGYYYLACYLQGRFGSDWEVVSCPGWGT